MYLYVCILSVSLYTHKEKKVTNQHIPKIQLQEIKCLSCKSDLWGTGEKETLLEKLLQWGYQVKRYSFHLSSSYRNSQAGLTVSNISLHEAIYKQQETYHHLFLFLLKNQLTDDCLVHVVIFLPFDLFLSLFTSFSGKRWQERDLGTILILVPPFVN